MQVPLPPPPPQAAAPIDIATSRSNVAKQRRQQLRLSVAKNKMQAKTKLTGKPHRTGPLRIVPCAHPIGAVVVMVRVAAPPPGVVILTLLVEPKFNAGSSTAPPGLEVIAAVRVTVPVNPPIGLTVMVD